MLIWGGLIMDRFGVRFTGKLATILMVVGTLMEYYGMNYMGGSNTIIMGYKSDVLMCAAGYAIFGVGAETAGITVTKIIARWFRGKEMALAMGIQVALARIGSQAAYSLAIPIAKRFEITTPVLIGLVLLVVGMISFFVFAVMDKKLDAQESAMDDTDEEKFSFADVKNIITNRGFWLISILCVLFYSCIFPFQKFASALMITKYGIDPDFAGTIVGLPALGALLLTPIFGGLIDRKGKSASIMMLGAAILIGVHFTYAIPSIDSWVIAVALMILLGIAFSLVPSAMWPAVAKIFPVRQLGTAYALIFFIQNIGLWGIPTLMGYVQEHYCVVGVNENGAALYNYTLPMIIFGALATASFIVAYLLLRADKKYGYGLELPNIKK